MVTDIIKNRHLLFVLSILLLTQKLYAQCKSEEKEASYIYEILASAPLFEGVEVIEHFKNSSNEFDIMEVHRQTGYKTTFTSNRLLYNDGVFYFNNDPLKGFVNKDSLMVLMEQNSTIGKHAIVMCLSKLSADESYIYLFSRDGKLKKSIISNVPLEKINFIIDELDIEIKLFKYFISSIAKKGFKK